MSKDLNFQFIALFCGEAESLPPGGSCHEMQMYFVTEEECGQ